jgi:serine/threonine protein kinase
MRHDNKEHLHGKVETVLQALHKFDILHRDVDPRSLLYDVENDQVMIIDLERAESLGRQPLRPLQANLKRKWIGDEHLGNEDVFDNVK